MGDDANFVYTASKDCCIIKWDLATGKKTIFKGQKLSKITPEINAKLSGHSDQILAVAISSDGKFLASGGKDKIIRIWDPTLGKQIHCFTGHRDVITALVFRKDSHHLYSGSSDRTIRIWNCDEMTFMETLYGHAADILSVDCLIEERAVSCGQDRTARYWKVVEETQLLFRGAHTTTVDCITMLNSDRFLTGSQDGSIAFWNVRKKNPTAVIPNAHNGEWITSLAALPYSDLVASGSSDGMIRFWKCELKNGKLTPLTNHVMIGGFVNGLVWAKKGKKLIAAIGQEHRLGRWKKVKKVKNGIMVLTLASD